MYTIFTKCADYDKNVYISSLARLLIRFRKGFCMDEILINEIVNMNLAGMTSSDTANVLMTGIICLSGLIIANNITDAISKRNSSFEIGATGFKYQAQFNSI